MALMSDFAGTLRGLRQSRGFSSARSFFRDAGGTRTLRCTYKAYLNVEAGRSLPLPPLALRLAQALGFPAEAPGCRRYISAYVRQATGRGELSAIVLKALEEAPPSGPEELFQRASEVGFSARHRLLTEGQVRLLQRDRRAYWCFTLLSNDSGRWGVADLARTAGEPPAAARTALARLKSAGLVARGKDGLFNCPQAGRVFVYPRRKLFMSEVMTDLRRHWEGMASKRGAVLRKSSWTVVSTPERLREVMPAVTRAVYGAHVYSRRDGGPDSGIFVADVTVRRLR